MRGIRRSKGTTQRKVQALDTPRFDDNAQSA